VIDPLGRTVAAAPVNARMIVAAQAGPRERLTWYVRLGDWVAWLCGLIVAVAAIWRVRRRGLQGG
jgi:apolipoprotein N-acyltransferase